MVIYILLATYALCIAWVAMIFIHISQFSNFMSNEIERVFKARVNGDMNIHWPDVKKCYDNLKWYKPFDYNFQRMMVYDHSY